eukprot:scaffold4538_cov86-Skeletonema_dohrnii-CCMP3373.AAC.1
MPSKKKSSRGKARKGDNRKKKQEEEEQGPLDEQMERLKINDDSIDEATLLEEAIKLAAVEKEALGCSHGLLIVPEKDISIIKDFANTFIDGYNSVGAESDLGECLSLVAASRATAEKYPAAWEDASKIKLVVSLFASNGTQHLLEEEDIHRARLCASSAFFLQTRSACLSSDNVGSFDGTLPVGIVTKMIELTSCDLHTLAKYLRKNIPCNCLDEKYEEVKSITKMGVCWNDKCSLPSRMVERSTMLYCTRCRAANYCSRECQKADWPVHKSHCDARVSERAMWESRKQT